jgi:NADH-quinone oxidoreductase subunit J
MVNYLPLIIFYVFACLAVLSALWVILSNNPVHSVLALVLTFFASAGVWLLAQAEFLALVLILVYVGAVMTLFLFVIMMLDINVVTLRARIFRSLPLGLLVAVLFSVFLGGLLQTEQFNRHSVHQGALPTQINVEQIGLVLYTQYAYAFVLAGVILLSAIIASICLAHRNPRARKSQDPRAQIQVRSIDRVRMVNMPPEQYE